MSGAGARSRPWYGRFGRAACWPAILLQDPFAGVEKKFLVAFGAPQTAGQDIDAGEASGFGGASDGGNGFLVEADVLDNSAGSDVCARQFELRFDENKKFSAGFSAGKGRADDFANGNERDVGDDEIDWLGNFRGA